MTGKSRNDTPAEKIVSTNRRARHEYHILENFECGIVLHGYEVKSIREGRVNIQDAYGTVKGEEAFVEHMHITPYSHGDLREIDPLRSRKLLLRRKEIDYLIGKTRERGLALVPLRLYFKGPRVKLEMGLARGKKLYDRRREIAERDARREIERETKGKRRPSRDAE
jgi:SsrA-binding protein